MGGEFLSFDQTEFANITGFDIKDTPFDTKNPGYVYIPNNCQNKSCDVHLALHGTYDNGYNHCHKHESKGSEYNYMYLNYAASNDIIMLCPSNSFRFYEPM